MLLSVIREAAIAARTIDVCPDADSSDRSAACEEPEHDVHRIAKEDGVLSIEGLGSSIEIAPSFLQFSLLRL